MKIATFCFCFVSNIEGMARDFLSGLMTTLEQQQEQQ